MKSILGRYAWSIMPAVIMLGGCNGSQPQVEAGRSYAKCHAMASKRLPRTIMDGRCGQGDQ